MFKVTYVGEGVVSNELGVFQNGTIAGTENEGLARRIAATSGWRVLDASGQEIGKPAPVAASAPASAAAGHDKKVHRGFKQDEGDPISESKRRHPAQDEMDEAGSK